MYPSSQPGPGGPSPSVSGGPGEQRFRHPVEKELRLDADRSGSVMRLMVVGTVDYDTKDVFTDAFAGHLHEAKTLVSDLVAEVRLDFSGLDQCDSSGLAALISAHRWTTAAGMRLHLANQPVFLQRLLTLTGLAEFFAAGAGADHPVRRQEGSRPAGIGE